MNTGNIACNFAMPMNNLKFFYTGVLYMKTKLSNICCMLIVHINERF